MPADFTNTATLRAPEHRPVDEYANLITHGLGLLLSVVASALLMALAIDVRRGIEVVAYGTYCASLIGLYAASTLSHMFHDLAWRRFFRTVDQAFIYVMIAGSFTPVGVMYLGRGWWPALPASMWVMAICGVALVLRVGNLSHAAKISYGILGWMPALSLPLLAETVPLEILGWMLAGGLYYSVGTVFLWFDQEVRYFHAMWHALVIAGSVCHYLAILLLVVAA
jgi:hemolysin III